MRNLELARSRAREAADEAAGTVTVASTHMLAFTFLPGRLAEAEPSLAGASIHLLVDAMAACGLMLRVAWHCCSAITTRRRPRRLKERPTYAPPSTATGSSRSSCRS